MTFFRGGLPSFYRVFSFSFFVFNSPSRLKPGHDPSTIFSNVILIWIRFLIFINLIVDLIVNLETLIFRGFSSVFTQFDWVSLGIGHQCYLYRVFFLCLKTVAKQVKPGSFFARDNVHNFITWCRLLGIYECLLFETDDLVLRKNEKSFILCLLEVGPFAFSTEFYRVLPSLTEFDQVRLGFI